jgi:HSP20 family protein
MFVQRVWPSRPTFESPFGDSDQLRREMLRLLEAFSEDRIQDTTAGVFPPVNVTQDAENFYVRAEVPGIEAKNLSISAVRNRLLLSGTRQIAKESERVSYHRRERAEGAFNRTLTLPSEVDADRVEARYADGVVMIVLPKADAAKPRLIKVTT